MYGGFTWLVSFITDLGDVSSITADIMSMTGSAPVLAVSENVQGVAPSFASLDPYNALPLGSATLTDLSDLSMLASGLEQGVAYYFRVTASNYIGPGAGKQCSYGSYLLHLQPIDRHDDDRSVSRFPRIGSEAGRTRPLPTCHSSRRITYSR